MNSINTVVIVTGGFDPIHAGHISYIKSARELGDYLVVGLNSDAWLTRKKGRPFMSWHDRSAVLSEMSSVDWVVDYDDSDGSSINAIRKVKEKFPEQTIIFANGGDRTAANIPEMTEKDVVFKFGIGGEEKLNSSSWILNEWKAPKTDRAWGYYRVLHEVPGTKVKELTVDPGKSLSMQRHFKRNEYWIVSEGSCILNSMMNSGYNLPSVTLSKHSSHIVPVGQWHQLVNPFDEPCRIVEIQYGDECEESDIERE